MRWTNIERYVIFDNNMANHMWARVYIYMFLD